jgi:hypothetical protein
MGNVSATSIGMSTQRTGAVVISKSGWVGIGVAVAVVILIIVIAAAASTATISSSSTDTGTGTGTQKFYRIESVYARSISMDAKYLDISTTGMLIITPTGMAEVRDRLS